MMLGVPMSVSRQAYETVVGLAVIALAVLEMVLERAWCSWHYRHGIVIYRSNLKRSATATELAAALNGKSVGWGARIAVWPIGSNEVGLFVDGPGLGSHVPIVRGHIVATPHSVLVRGRIGWTAPGVGAGVAAMIAGTLWSEPGLALAVTRFPVACSGLGRLCSDETRRVG